MYLKVKLKSNWNADTDIVVILVVAWKRAFNHERSLRRPQYLLDRVNRYVADHYICIYALSAKRVSMIAQVCILAPLPLLRVRDHCKIFSGKQNSEYRRNIDKCALLVKAWWGTQRWTSQRPVAAAVAAVVAAAVVRMLSRKAGFKNAVPANVVHNIYIARHLTLNAYNWQSIRSPLLVIPRVANVTRGIKCQLERVACVRRAVPLMQL